MNSPPEESAERPARRRASLGATLMKVLVAVALIAGPPYAWPKLTAINDAPFVEQAILGTCWFVAWLLVAPRTVGLAAALVITLLGAALVGSAYAIWSPDYGELFVWSSAISAQLSCHGGNLIVLGGLSAVVGATKRR